VLGIVLVGSVLSVGGATLMKPVYDAQATVIVTRGSVRDAAGRSTGPIRAQDLIGNESWLELLRSYTVIDPVVNELQLFLSVKPDSDWPRFAGMQVAPDARGGRYTLVLDSVSRRWRLSERTRGDLGSEAFGDSVGRAEGFRWRPTEVAAKGGDTLHFAVTPPRDVAADLLKRHRVERQLTSDFLTLGITESNPKLAADIVNRWTNSFVTAAADLTRRNLSDFTLALREQLDVAARNLRNAEIALESFRVSTITLPSENAPVAGGVEATRNPVFQAYFAQKIEYDALRRDREALERIIGESVDNPSAYESLLSVPGVLSSAEPLRAALTEVVAKESELRTARRTYTEDHPVVRELMERITELRSRTLPQMASQSLDQLRRREAELSRRIAGAATEMREIPTRTIEELRLRREVEVSSTLYTQLQQRYEEARLADAGTVANVRLVDPALVPRSARAGRSAKLAGVGILASIFLAIFIAWGRDRIDRRFRYPEQAPEDLGLTVIGAVPHLSSKARGTEQLIQQQQLVESFRSLALQVRRSAPAGEPIVITILSGEPGDGKSLIACNLATTLAGAGVRTLLVDADIRRGRLFATFGVPQAPGLVELLEHSELQLAEVERETGTKNLTLLTSGATRSTSPELLTGERLTEVLDVARSRFDCIVLDSAPLGAGVDAYALTAAAGTALVVVRVGKTDRRLLDARLVLLDRLPVRVLGAVLNGINVDRDRAYASYTYLPEYAVTPSLPSGAAAS
jgi:tyrosine-protein kinase Etk/Wzc